MPGVKIGLLEGFKIAKKGGKLLVDISIAPWTNSAHNYDQKERIVYDDLEDIIGKGYVLSEGLKTSLAYYNLPVYVKLHNGTVCDYEHGWTDRYGIPVPEGTPGAYP